MLYSLTIQGRYAVHYQFKRQSAQNFNSLVRGIVSRTSAVIVSRFRTDVLYHAEQPAKESILRLWARQLGEELSESQLHHFKYKEGSEAVFEYYFTSLAALQTMKPWYEEYVEAFRYVFSLDRHNSILKQLVSCDQHLQETLNNPKRQQLVSDVPDIYLPQPCPFSDVALNAIATATEN